VLPIPDLLLVAAETPVVILEREVYYLSEAESPAGFLAFEDTRYGLVHTETLAEVEARYFDLQADALEAFKTAYLRETVDRRIEHAAALQKQLRESQVAAFLVREMVPRLLALCPGADEYAQRRSRLRDEALQRLLACEEKCQPPNGSLLTMVLDRSLILDGKVYALDRYATQPRGDLELYAGEQRFALALPARFLSRVTQECLAHLEVDLRRRALAESPERLRCLRALELERQALDDYLDAQASTGSGYLYRDRERGIMQAEGGYYVYLEVPAYAVEHADRSVYHFDATRVAVLVNSVDPKAVLGAGRAVVLTDYQHMFVNEAKAGQRICMVRDATYYAGLCAMGLAEGVLAYLHDARQTLVAGHHADNESSPYHAITSFASRRITRAEAERRRLPIYPYYR
jgi:hypothetical protein